MSKEEMDEVRTNYSKAANSSAWKNRPGEMYKKTVLRLNLKNVEKVFENPEQLRAYEEASEFEFNKTDSKTLPAAPVVKNIYTEQVKQIEANPVETTTSEILPAGPGPKEENQTEEFFCEAAERKFHGLKTVIQTNTSANRFVVLVRQLQKGTSNVFD